MFSWIVTSIANPRLLGFSLAADDDIAEDLQTSLQRLISFRGGNEPVALDCEMVGVGFRGLSALGRISIVAYNGEVLYDVMCRPEDEITDYRTPWSGIRPSDMLRAIPFESVREQVGRIIKDRIVVGHMIWNDFKVLQLHHPNELIRDTGTAPYAKVKAGLPPNRPTALRHLAEKLLGVRIQIGEHCSTEDAHATMAIYRLVENEWEDDLQTKTKLVRPTIRNRGVVFSISSPSHDSESSAIQSENDDTPQRPISLYNTKLSNSCSSSSFLLEDEYWCE